MSHPAAPRPSRLDGPRHRLLRRVRLTGPLIGAVVAVSLSGCGGAPPQSGGAPTTAGDAPPVTVPAVPALPPAPPRPPLPANASYVGISGRVDCTTPGGKGTTYARLRLDPAYAQSHSFPSGRGQPCGVRPGSVLLRLPEGSCDDLRPAAPCKGPGRHQHIAVAGFLVGNRWHGAQIDADSFRGL